MTPIELPEKYYLDYFESLLEFVQDKYGGLLNRREKQFIRKFGRFSEDARCLFIRLMNRKGCYFRVQKLNYAEIQSFDEALNKLISQRFFSRLAARHHQNMEDLLRIFTKAELLSLLAEVNKELKKQAGKLKKDEIVQLILANADLRQFTEHISRREPIVKVNFEQETEMLRFLYFGNIHGDMTQFVVRDIGYVKTEELNASKLQARFKSRKEAEDKLLMSRIYQQFKDRRDVLQQPVDEIFQWFQQLNITGASLNETAQPQFDKLCLRLGKLLEQQKFPAFALDIYQHTAAAPSRERQARLMHKLGLTTKALELCEQIRQAPKNAEEKYFAEDFCDLINKKRKVKRTTHYLKSSSSIELDEERRFSVELGVLEHFCERGYEGVFSENHLWRSFFGLFFWDIIFDQDSGALHHPLQTTPSDFYTPEFLTKRRKQIDQRLQALAYPNRFYNIVRHHFQSKMGISNPLVGWQENLLPLVEQCYNKLQPEQISSVLLEMAGNLKENARGFPDLFIWNKDSYSFIEVKSPNDQLSAQQLYWLHFFEEQEIEAKVVRVQWQP